jgi:lysophospholipid acyltransferase (LPLAT)-like uncharacterized protein
VIRSKFGIAVSIQLGRALIRALGATWRFRAINDAPYRALMEKRQPFIFAVWHGDLLAPMFYHRRDGVAAMVSEHRDGEIIAQIIHGFGFDTVRGSTTRGASRALLAAIRKLEGGAVLAITPDGPRGPRHELQPGVLAAAQRARVPIVFVAEQVSRAWEFRSWDRFRLPKPFARITIAYSEPSYVDASAPDVSTELERFAALARATMDVAEGTVLHD